MIYFTNGHYKANSESGELLCQQMLRTMICGATLWGVGVGWGDDDICCPKKPLSLSLSNLYF